MSTTNLSGERLNEAFVMGDGCQQAAVPHGAHWGLFIGWMVLALAALGRSIAHEYDVVSTWLHRETLPNFGIWTIFLALVLVINRVRAIPLQWRAKIISPWWIVCISGVCFAALLPTLDWSLMYGCVVFLLNVAVGLYVFWGIQAVRLFFPAFILLASLPVIPIFVEIPLIYGLKCVTTSVAYTLSWVFLSEFYQCDGFRIFLHEGFLRQEKIVSVVVEDVCSGYRSLIGVSLFAFALATNIRLSLSSKTIFIAFGIFVALLANWGRVFFSITLFHYGHGRWAEGAMHSFQGLAILVVEMILLYWVYQIMLAKSCR